MLLVASVLGSTVKLPAIELAPAMVVNQSEIYEQAIVPSGILAPEQVLNSSLIFNQEIARRVVHSWAPEQVVNASLVYVQTVAAILPPVTTSYDNPGGKGNRTATIAVAFDGTLGGGSTINNLVDGAFADTSADACWWHTGQSARTIRFDFGTPKVIQEAKLYASSPSNNGTWKWRGSNDGSSYTDLSAGFLFAGATAGAICGNLSANNAPYRYYQLFQVSGTTLNWWQREMEFKISA